MIRVLVADGHGLVRDGLRLILAAQPDIDVVGDASTATELVDAADELDPDVILMEHRLGPVDSAGVAATILASHPMMRVLFMALRADGQIALRAVLSGGSGIVLKTRDAAEISAAIRLVASGRPWIDRTVVACLFDDVRSVISTERRAGVTAQLTPDQARLLQYVSNGMTQLEISSRTGVPEPLVAGSLDSLLDGLSQVDHELAAAWAFRHKFFGCA